MGKICLFVLSFFCLQQHWWIWLKEDIDLDSCQYLWEWRKDIKQETAPHSSVVGPSENKRKHECMKDERNCEGRKCNTTRNTWDCCCEYAGCSSVGFMMAGCVFWEGTGVEFGAFPWAACYTPQANSVNILVIKTQSLKGVINARCFLCNWEIVDKWMRWQAHEHTHTHLCTHSVVAVQLTVLASVKGLYSSRPPGGADRVTCVTEGS